jgi:uncharacterized protein YkwD
MRAGSVVGAITVMAALAAVPAQAGPIPRTKACPDQNMTLRSPADVPRYRAAVVCVIGRVRHARGLNVLRRDARLERAGQLQAEHRAKVGVLGHSGDPNVVIPRQIRAQGYKAAAVNEGIGWGDLAAATPFEVVSGMMVQYDACAQIQDRRFRDIGVGLAHRGPGETFNGNPNLHVTVEYGLKAGTRPPKVRKRKVTCPRRLTGGVSKQGDSLADRSGTGEGRLTVRGWAVVEDGRTVTQYLACVGTTDCRFDYAVRLHNTGVARMVGTHNIPHGARFPVGVTFGPEEIDAELAAAAPAAELIVDDVVVGTVPLYREVSY